MAVGHGGLSACSFLHRRWPFAPQLKHLLIISIFSATFTFRVNIAVTAVKYTNILD